MRLDHRTRGLIVAYYSGNPFVRLRIAALLVLLLIALGTAGYVFLERYTPLDALFMTVITLSTIGYEEVHPLHAGGKVFTIFLIIFGLGIAAWALTTTFEALISEQSLRILERRRMNRLIGTLENHFIVCGYGRIGQAIVNGYQTNKVPFVVVEIAPERIEQLRAQEVPYVEGDASNDEILKSAGIEKAQALIAVTSTDASNTFIILSARVLRPDLMMVARSVSPANTAKFYLAGATKVVSPHILGGWWMSVTAVNPAVTDFIEALSAQDRNRVVLYEFRIENELAGKSFEEAQVKEKTGALVLAIRRESGFFPNPEGSLVLERGNTIIALGSLSQLENLARICNPDRPAPINLPINQTPSRRPASRDPDPR
ncbi:MAG TPA: potassium channel protein [Capsulimonadaceae bacterium]|nr:potassium channel protein [Capsulimonadaceae bacterium]